jgi:ribosomal protein S18 acetylase RimI-like enzyme
MYKKAFYVFNKEQPINAIIRNYNETDFPDLIRIQQECFPPPYPEEALWTEEQLQNHVHLFSEGALCIEVAGELAGSMTTLLIDFDPKEPDHTWANITDNGYIQTHNPNGNTLYVVDIAVRPSFRSLGIGKWLMSSMYDLVIEKRLARLLGGGRMPHYHKYREHMSAEEYLDAVLDGTLKDPVITFLLRCGRTPVKVVQNYLDDEESCHYGALMEWKNPFYNGITKTKEALK